MKTEHMQYLIETYAPIMRILVRAGLTADKKITTAYGHRFSTRQKFVVEDAGLSISITLKQMRDQYIEDEGPHCWATLYVINIGIQEYDEAMIAVYSSQSGSGDLVDTVEMSFVHVPGHDHFLFDHMHYNEGSKVQYLPMDFGEDLYFQKSLVMELPDYEFCKKVQEEVEAVRSVAIGDHGYAYISGYYYKSIADFSEKEVEGADLVKSFHKWIHDYTSEREASRVLGTMLADRKLV